MKKQSFKYIKITILLFVFLMCKQVYIPKAETKILNENLNKTLDLQSMSIRYSEIMADDLFKPLTTYKGDLTGYSADCPLCSGYLGCINKNVLAGRITSYDDIDYGTVKIVASSKKIPCGSIVNFKLKNEEIIAIVLDRGVYNYDLDLLVESEEYARKNIGRSKISYDILRFGYEKDN